jgi:hypothetical protein
MRHTIHVHLAALDAMLGTTNVQWWRPKRTKSQKPKKLIRAQESLKQRARGVTVVVQRSSEGRLHGYNRQQSQFQWWNIRWAELRGSQRSRRYSSLVHSAQQSTQHQVHREVVRRPSSHSEKYAMNDEKCNHRARSRRNTRESVANSDRTCIRILMACVTASGWRKTRSASVNNESAWSRRPDARRAAHQRTTRRAKIATAATMNAYAPA